MTPGLVVSSESQCGQAAALVRRAVTVSRLKSPAKAEEETRAERALNEAL